ncbi:hypothetical protein K1T71_012728 [Dendrolimus kikuchii]|uniref:Uncharacterized protein n=1 Tax=Dendrolimus kikuchii TaxID=765133 RepID=A0ACC1CK41_9NEOP|nr:hypothetical protein K1T71_012728 [Dendrolimus kikuchii]
MHKTVPVPKMARLLLIILIPILLAMLFPVYIIFLKSPPPLPEMDYNAWWGPTSLKEKQDKSIKPFKVSFDNLMVKDLKDRIKRSRSFTPPLEGIGFEYGFNTNQLPSWLKYWSEEYNFTAREAFFNQYPHFKTNIQGMDIHFIRVTPKVPSGVQVVPLLLIHGWPGSVREFYEAIPLLTAVSKDRDFAIELIIPSLPGYGFSDPAVRPGLGAAEVAIVMRNLMHRIGYKKFYIQGGDWGSIVNTYLATIFPKEVLGFHSNLAFLRSSTATLMTFIGSFYPSLIVDPELADWMYPLKEKYAYLLEETGYMHIQATKPDTVAAGLNDSPAGLLAYILEKFSTWTKREYRQKADGGLLTSWTKEKLIDNLMLYWSTKSIVTSCRLYSETFNSRHTALRLDDIPSPVPTWVLQAKYELSYQPPSIMKLKFPNLINTTVVHDGGHFFAFEMPQVFAEDVLKAITAFRKLPSNQKTEL